MMTSTLGGQLMVTRFAAAGLVGLALSAASVAAPIRFDFGNGNVSDDTGVAANVVIANNSALGTEIRTVDGVTITLTGIADPQAGSLWRSTQNGIGIETFEQAGGANVRPRIDGPLGEFINFSFDTDMTINSIRLGNMTPNDAGGDEVVEIAFVSGDDPFAGGSYTYSTSSGGPTGPTDDIPVGVFVTANTVLSFTASVPQNNGVLWNDMVATPIPEPNTIALMGLAAAFAVALRRRGLDEWMKQGG